MVVTTNNTKKKKKPTHLIDSFSTNIHTTHNHTERRSRLKHQMELLRDPTMAQRVSSRGRRLSLLLVALAILFVMTTWLQTPSSQEYQPADSSRQVVDRDTGAGRDGGAGDLTRDAVAAAEDEEGGGGGGGAGSGGGDMGEDAVVDDTTNDEVGGGDESSSSSSASSDADDTTTTAAPQDESDDTSRADDDRRASSEAQQEEEVDDASSSSSSSSLARTSASASKSTCGDGRCEPPETAETCMADCPGARGTLTSVQHSHHYQPPPPPPHFYFILYSL